MSEAIATALEAGVARFLPALGVIDFVRSDFLLFLLVLPLWALLLWPWVGSGLLHARGEALRGMRRGRWVSPLLLLGLPRLLRALALTVLILGLADPERVSHSPEVDFLGRGIALAVDLSSSMLARDMEGGASRIEVAREAAVRFAERRSLDELSLVGFAAQSVTRVPPTRDPGLVVTGVETLAVQLVRDGTDISGAVLTAATRLLDSERQPRVLILLTDGAHNGVSVPPLTAARAAAALGIRVHAISVQGPESALALPNRPGGSALGNRVVEEMRTVLAGIADLTGGEYFHAVDGAALDSIYREIDRIESPIPELREVERRQPLRGWLFGITLLLLGAEALLRGSRWGVIP